MKRVSAALILTALASTAVAQTSAQTSAAPSFSTAPRQPSQVTPTIVVPSTGPISQGSQSGLGDETVNDCTSQVKVSHPGLTEEQIREYCQRSLDPSSPQD
jgi:hypothetical protein